MRLKKAIFSLICLNYALVNADQNPELDLYVEPANLSQYIVSKPYPKVKLSNAFGVYSVNQWLLLTIAQVCINLIMQRFVRTV